VRELALYPLYPLAYPPVAREKHNEINRVPNVPTVSTKNRQYPNIDLEKESQTIQPCRVHVPTDSQKMLITPPTRVQHTRCVYWQDESWFSRSACVSFIRKD
jgi:hypothetical protein